MRYASLLLAALVSTSVFAPKAYSANACVDLFQHARKIPGILAAKPRVIIISAPSGAGKSTLIAKLTSEFPENFAQSVSTTTRPVRGQEVDGKDYHFTSVPEFEARLKKGDFLEYAGVHGNYYGTSKAEVEKILASGRSAILIIDVKGAEQVRQALGGKLTTIFVTVPSYKVLEQRLRGRNTDPEEAIQKRLKNAREEMSHKGEYDRTIINDDLDRSYGRLVKYLSGLPEMVSRPPQEQSIDLSAQTVSSLLSAQLGARRSAMVTEADGEQYPAELNVSAGASLPTLAINPTDGRMSLNMDKRYSVNDSEAKVVSGAAGLLDVTAVGQSPALESLLSSSGIASYTRIDMIRKNLMSGEKGQQYLLGFDAQKNLKRIYILQAVQRPFGGGIGLDSGKSGFRKIELQ